MSEMSKILDKDEILITFCIIDDIIKALGMQGDKQQEMSNSEVLTVGCIAHQYFGANYQATLSFLKPSEQSLFPKVLSKSRFTRRLHRFLDFLPQILSILSETKREISLRSRYFIDSFPVPACENIRIKGIRWKALRRQGSKKREGEEDEREKRRARRLVESVGSVLRLYLGKRVQAVTLSGFLLKTKMAIISYDLHRLFCLLS